MQKKSPESCAVFPGALASTTTYELPNPQSSSGATVLAQNFGSLVLSGPKPLRCVRNADEKKKRRKPNQSWRKLKLRRGSGYSEQAMPSRNRQCFRPKLGLRFMASR